MKKFTLTNFVQKMKDPKQRKYFYALFGGKIFGVGVLFMVMTIVSIYLSSPAKLHAQTNTAAATTNAPVVASTNAAAAGDERARRGSRAGCAQPALRQPHQHHVGAGHGVPGVFHAGGFSCFLKPASRENGKQSTCCWKV